MAEGADPVATWNKKVLYEVWRGLLNGVQLAGSFVCLCITNYWLGKQWIIAFTSRSWWLPKTLPRQVWLCSLRRQYQIRKPRCHCSLLLSHSTMMIAEFAYIFWIYNLPATVSFFSRKDRNNHKLSSYLKTLRDSFHHRCCCRRLCIEFSIVNIECRHVRRTFNATVLPLYIHQSPSQGRGYIPLQVTLSQTRSTSSSHLFDADYLDGQNSAGRHGKTCWFCIS